ncbi:LOW QUALITY PROTEIN: hypothetical protein OSB04_013417 [Centaurea solstitialis]|uniref:SWIM-type domain-containing protein n=1 Tax=Centaurea solstitialis TaxID=347529 RepID=A0AA38TXY9_9ASTR|nr:LOW QUALITY PROTEIN: hypothetical protein OSB04_013417 [Centaurea solstitialis]
MATAQFLSTHITEQVKMDPNMPLKAIQSHLSEKFEIHVSQSKAMRAKHMANKKIWETSSHNIISSGIISMRCNPDTTVKLEVEIEPNLQVETRKFKRVYICLGSLKKGFRAGKRDLLGLDGTFMKGPFPGQILTAVGVDSNHGIYPVAYAIVEAETTNSWKWFLECLGDDLDLQANSNFTFVSDRQKGIIPAIAKMFPSAEHRFCLRHIQENMKLQWKGQAYKDLLWECAAAYTVPQFKTAMEKLKRFNARCHDWLMKIPLQHWSRAHFTGRCKCDVLLNNMCEVFNKQIVDARDKPIYSCLEYIRVYLMKRIVNVCKVIESKDGPLTPTAQGILDKAKTEASKLHVLFNGEHRYQVSGPMNDQCIVDVRAKTCTCRQWELTGIPCKHAVAANWNMGVNGINVVPEAWVDISYRLTTWKEMYSFKIEPINGRLLWDKTNCPSILLPPKHHKQVGRPKKKRKKSSEEMKQKQVGTSAKLSRKGKTVTCDKCKHAGHNSRTCKGQGGPSNKT